MIASIEGHDLHHAKQSLRLWIRIFLITTLVEKKIRGYLKEECETTLPRFDAMAALDRAGEKITMSQLSERLLVSNGNVTVLINRLVEDGLVDRNNDGDDKRVQYVKLTPAGRKQFGKMAKKHEAFIDAVFKDIDDDEISAILDNIGALAGKVQKNLSAL